MSLGWWLALATAILASSVCPLWDICDWDSPDASSADWSIGASRAVQIRPITSQLNLPRNSNFPLSNDCVEFGSAVQHTGESCRVRSAERAIQLHGHFQSVHAQTGGGVEAAEPG